MPNTHVAAATTDFQYTREQVEALTEFLIERDLRFEITEGDEGLYEAIIYGATPEELHLVSEWELNYADSL